jgi:hypothetical protein
LDNVKRMRSYSQRHDDNIDEDAFDDDPDNLNNSSSSDIKIRRTSKKIKEKNHLIPFVYFSR